MKGLFSVGGHTETCSDLPAAAAAAAVLGCRPIFPT